MLGRINHSIVFVKDLDKAMDFWCGKAGLRVKYRDGPHLELDTKGTTLTLLQAKPKSRKETGINFWVSDIQRVYKVMSNRGVKFDSPPIKQAWGSKLARFFDNEGNAYYLEGD